MTNSVCSLCLGTGRVFHENPPRKDTPYSRCHCQVVAVSQPDEVRSVDALGTEIAKLMDVHGIKPPLPPKFWLALEKLLSGGVAQAPTNRQLHDAIASAVTHRTYSGIQDAVREIQKLYGSSVPSASSPAQASLDPCPYEVDGGCVLENGSIGPCLCVNPVAKASAVPSAEGKSHD